MKSRRLLGIALFGLLLLAGTAIFGGKHVRAAKLAAPSPTATASTPAAANIVLCPPGIYPQGYAEDCIAAGPAAYLTRMAALGYLYPPRPLPATPLPASWDTLPGKWHYAQVLKDEGRALYPSLKDAAQGTRARHLPQGFVYVSYTQAAYYEGRTYYMVDEEGWWMRHKDLGAVTPSTFRGLRFTQTPTRPFGWAIRPATTRRSPGYASQITHRTLARYDIVQVYDTAEANGIAWYMIAPDEWVPQQTLGLVFPRQSPPVGITDARWIEVNLFEQTLAAYENGQLVFATLVSSGQAPFWTVPGLFRIYEKHESVRMRGAFAADRSDYYQLDDVPWTMYYDKTRALHGAYWHDAFGYKTSHGCINLSIADAHWLYEWAEMGTPVYVWDPSGQTPTEEEVEGGP